MIFNNFYKKIFFDKKIVDKFIEFIECDYEGQSSGPISKTSWNTGGRVRDNLEIFYNRHLRKKIESKIGKVKLLDIWYQKYNANSGSFHDYHIHPSSDFSVVFYLKMENDKKLFTEYIIGDKIKKPNVKVGNMIIFNSYILHRSPPNNSSEDKIIISMNLVKE